MKYIFLLSFFILLNLNANANALLNIKTDNTNNQEKILEENIDNNKEKDEDIIVLNNLTELKKEKNELSEEELLKEKTYLLSILNSIIAENYTKSISSEITKEINSLELKIQINEKSNFLKAVSRDQAKLLALKNKIFYKDFIDNIINLRKSFAKENDFLIIINDFNNEINNESLFKLKKEKDELINKKELSNIDNDFIKNIEELEDQVLVLNLIKSYIKDNINNIAKKNIFLEKLKIDTYVNYIDNIKYIKEFNFIMLYNFKITLGKLILAFIYFSLIIIFRFIILNLIIKILEISSDNNNILLFKKYLKKTLTKPLNFILLIFAIEIFLKNIYNNQFDLAFCLSITKSLYALTFILLIKNAFSNYLNIYSETILNYYPNVRKEILLFMQRLFNILLFAISISIILSNLGYDITVILGGLGVFGIGVSLATKETFGHFLGSINLLLDKPFEPNDWIISGNIEGTVIEIGMRGTRIRTFDNAMISVPNSILASASIINYSKRVLGRRIKMDITITYESKINDFKNLVNDIRQMLNDHPEIANPNTSIDIRNKERKSLLLNKENDIGIKKTLIVRFDSYGEYSKNIMVYCFTKTTDWEKWLEIKEDIMYKIEMLVLRNNCEFAYPTSRRIEDNGESLKNNIILSKN